MRRYLQQGRGKLVGHRGRQGALVGLAATVLYLLTMDRSVSWWDCGEFIATGHLLQVGHPPGAPLYQLLQHLFTLFSFGPFHEMPKFSGREKENNSRHGISAVKTDTSRKMNEA